jgi:hypothetical protein
MPIAWMPGFLGALGVLAFVVSTVQSRPLRGGVITDGTVVEVETRTDTVGAGTPRHRMRTYAPKVEYRDSAGSTHRVTSSISGGVRPTVGATVRISYLPDSPDRARIMADGHTMVGRYLFLVVGVGLLVAAVLLR